MELGREDAMKTFFCEQWAQPEHRTEPHQSMGYIRQIGFPINEGNEGLHRLPHRITDAFRFLNTRREDPEEGFVGLLQLGLPCFFHVVHWTHLGMPKASAMRISQ